MRRLLYVVSALAAALIATGSASAHTEHTQASPAGAARAGFGPDARLNVQALFRTPAARRALAAAVGPVVDLRILSISDWHAQLEPLGGGIGGAAHLSAYFQQERAANPNTLTLTAGDAYGASPPLSGFFGERPAVQALRLMGVNADTFGNHNFDRGIAHLQSMIDLARSPGEAGGKLFYVSSNLAALQRNLKRASPYKIFAVGGVKMAVIGITNPEAPSLVFPGNFGTIVPSDPVAAALRARSEAAAEGAQVFVAITHLGITNTTTNTGPLTDFANAVSGFDLILGDHTDAQYQGVHNGALVVENRSRGATYARISLQYDAGAGSVITRSATFVTPTNAGVTPDPALTALIDGYRAQLTPIFSAVIGTSDVAVPRADRCGNSQGRICESVVGNVVTDAMRTTYGTDFAITNSGGLRDALTCVSGYATGFCPVYTPPPHRITRGQLQALLPFGNVVVTLSVNGAELKAMLENGVSSMPGVNGRFPQVSGLCFTYNIENAVNSRVLSAVRQAADGTCTGAAVDLTSSATYTLAENDFMASGGDTYPVLIGRAVTRNVMVEDVAAYVATRTPLTPRGQGRIVCFDPNPSSGNNCPTILT